MTLRRNRRARRQSRQLHAVAGKPQSVLRDDRHGLVERQRELVRLSREQRLRGLRSKQRGRGDL